MRSFKHIYLIFHKLTMEFIPFFKFKFCIRERERETQKLTSGTTNVVTKSCSFSVSCLIICPNIFNLS